MHTTCLQLLCKIDIFKEDNHKLAVSTRFVLILLLTSTVEQVLVQYCGSGSSGTMGLDFNTKCLRDTNKHIEISEHIAHSFSLSCPQFLQKRNLRPLSSVWQLFLLISYRVNSYSHFQAAETADAEGCHGVASSIQNVLHTKGVIQTKQIKRYYRVNIVFPFLGYCLVMLLNSY